jgi:hypothetical protein
LRFLESYQDKGKRLGDDGFAVLRATVAEFKVRRALAQSDPDARTADLEAAKSALDASKQLMDAIVEADPAVPAAFYHAAAQYHKARPLRRLLCCVVDGRDSCRLLLAGSGPGVCVLPQRHAGMRFI